MAGHAFQVFKAVTEEYDEEALDYRVVDESVLFADREDAEIALGTLQRGDSKLDPVAEVLAINVY